MSIFRNDTLGSWTRGGQAIVHNVRMTTQVFYQTMLAGLLLWLVGHSLAAFAAKRDPDFAPVLARHLRQKVYLTC